MIPTGEDFETRLLLGQHVSRIQILSQGSVVADSYYDDGLLLLNGTVDSDRQADSRISASVDVAVPDNSLVSALDPLRGLEAQVFKGLVYGGSVEWVRLATGFITGTSFMDDGIVTASLTIGDRAAKLASNPWKLPFRVAKDVNTYEAIRLICQDRASGFVPECNFGSTTVLTPELIFSEEESPWESIKKLAEGLGAEVYFDRLGVLRAHEIVDPKTARPVREFITDTDSGLIIGTNRDTGTEEFFNGIIVKGDAPWLLFPITGEVWDNDPMSPTYRYGPFGEKPKVYMDSIVTTDAQCQAAAEKLWLKVRGAVEIVSAPVEPDFRLEVGDVVFMKNDDYEISETVVLDKVSVSLTEPSVNISVRRRRG